MHVWLRSSDNMLKYLILKVMYMYMFVAMKEEWVGLLLT